MERPLVPVDQPVAQNDVRAFGRDDLDRLGRRARLVGILPLVTGRLEGAPAASCLPRSVSSTTLRSVTSTVASRFSIGLPHRLLSAPVVSAHGTFIRRCSRSGGATTGPTLRGKANNGIEVGDAAPRHGFTPARVLLDDVGRGQELLDRQRRLPVRNRRPRGKPRLRERSRRASANRPSLSTTACA